MKKIKNKLIYSKISNASIAATISILFCLVYLKFFILNSLPFQFLRENGLPNFSDDRDGWLAFANAFPNVKEIAPLSWQVNFWPPGNIGILSIGKFLSGSIFYASIFHIILVATIQAILVYQCVSLFSKERKALPWILLIVSILHLSFLFRSSFIDTVLLADYLASISLALGVVFSYKYFFESFKKSYLPLFAALAFALSGYLRVTTFQLTVIALFVTALCGAVLFLKKKLLNAIFLKTVAITLITTVLFAPWVIYRSVGIYNNDFSRGMQFSAQARFALSHQWDTPSELKASPSLKFMGLGTACAIDMQKCVWLADRQSRILAGTLPKTIEDEWDLRSKEAIKTFLANPITWINLKLTFFGQSFFQKSVYDSVDSRYHFSIDLILIILFIPISLYFILKISQSTRKFFVLVCFLSSMFLAAQLLITQSLLRFFLPSIALLVISLVLAVHSTIIENKKGN